MKNCFLWIRHNNFQEKTPLEESALQKVKRIETTRKKCIKTRNFCFYAVEKSLNLDRGTKSKLVFKLTRSLKLLPEEQRISAEILRNYTSVYWFFILNFFFPYRTKSLQMISSCKFCVYYKNKIFHCFYNW